MRWLSLAMLFSLATTGCTPHRPHNDAGVVGPEGGVLAFDAAMLVHPDTGHDAARDDAYVPPLPDAGRSCHGVAESCTTVGSFGCASQQGCYAHGQCTGFPSFCSDFFSSFTCTSQDGCYWSSGSNYCSGIARSCDAEPGSGSCASQQGCTWEDGCAGSATPCFDLFTPTSCSAQLGCYWS